MLEVKHFTWDYYGKFIMLLPFLIITLGGAPSIFNEGSDLTQSYSRYLSHHRSFSPILSSSLAYIIECKKRRQCICGFILLSSYYHSTYLRSRCLSKHMCCRTGWTSYIQYHSSTFYGVRKLLESWCDLYYPRCLSVLTCSHLA